MSECRLHSALTWPAPGSYAGNSCSSLRASRSISSEKSSGKHKGEHVSLNDLHAIAAVHPRSEASLDSRTRSPEGTRAGTPSWFLQLLHRAVDLRRSHKIAHVPRLPTIRAPTSGDTRHWREERRREGRCKMPNKGSDPRSGGSRIFSQEVTNWLSLRCTRNVDPRERWCNVSRNASVR